VFTFYTPEGATALQGALERFEGGRLVVNIVDLPIKCASPRWSSASWPTHIFHDRKLRERVELVFVTPLDGAFTKPVASKTPAGLLKDKGIQLVSEFNTGQVDGKNGKLVSYDERDVPSTWRRCAAARRRIVCGPLARPRRRARLYPGRRAHLAVQGGAERVRHWRRGVCRRRRPGPSLISKVRCW